jgi:hypothetical protein
MFGAVAAVVAVLVVQMATAANDCHCNGNVLFATFSAVVAAVVRLWWWWWGCSIKRLVQSLQWTWQRVQWPMGVFVVPGFALVAALLFSMSLSRARLRWYWRRQRWSK